MALLNKITRGNLHECILTNSTTHTIQEKKNIALNYVLNALKINKDDNDVQNVIEEITRCLATSFFNRYFIKWNSSNRKNERFQKENREWLCFVINFPVSVYKDINLKGINSSESVGRGRPIKTFDESSERSKRRKCQLLYNSSSLSELSETTSYAFRKIGNEDTAKLVKEAANSTPTRGKKIRDVWKENKNTLKPSMMSPEVALSLIIACSLSKFQYNMLRKNAKKHNHDLYPSYDQLLVEKVNAYPKQITIEEQKCEVQLQSLLNHTSKRILQSLPKPLQNISTLHCKWGFDGTSGFTKYKQLTSGASQDDTIFVTSLVPLRLVDDITNEVVWQNPACSSTRYCRPIRLQYVKESVDISKNEEKYISDQINSLAKFECEFGTINFILQLTMIDGKVCNALTESSSMACYVCGAKISQMNDLALMRTTIDDQSAYRYGLSTLHAYIRFFECLLHISYRMDFKVWKASKKDGKDIILKQKKLKIQNEFRSRLGLLVDMPKQGFGSSNDGNTARRFFKNYKISAEITGVSEDLIYHFYVILQCLSSGENINIDKYEMYCWETAELYTNLYSWYYMPPSVHKILIHGSSIIKSFVLPIGILSEEAQESRNKDIKRYRESYSRKSSRININTDIFQRLLLSSDPLISSFRKVDKHNVKKLLPEVEDLLLDINYCSDGEPEYNSE